MSASLLTVKDAAAALRSGAVTSVELTQTTIDRAEQLDKELGAYIVRFDDQALVTAADADAKFAAGIDNGPLQGIPYGAKDLLAVKGQPTEWGSRAFAGQKVDEDAFVLKKLDAAGGTGIAKVAMGSVTAGVSCRTEGA